MTKETIDLLIKGGAATAGPPLGPKLGPMGVNTGNVVKAINEKTAAMKGMDVPVKVTVDSDTKEFEISIGTPPTAALLKQELYVQKGSGRAKLDKVGDLPIDHVISIAKLKQDTQLAYTLKSSVKEVLGVCQSAGILVDGKEPRQVIKEVADGKYDSKLASEPKLLNEAEMKSRNKEYYDAAIQRSKQKAVDKETEDKKEK